MQSLRSLFLLDPDITFLNFGSFGACPKSIFENYIQWQYQLEREPVQFIAVEGPALIRNSRGALGRFVGCDTDDLVLFTNPSYAVNTVAKSFPLQAGDEVLSTDLEYGACDRIWNYYCKKAGAIYKRNPVKLPLLNKEAFVEDLFAAVTSRTRLIFISHITSSTALRFPVEDVIVRAAQLGIPVFVDGAHAPGQVALDLSNLGAAMYTGACHKWMMTPKGCSFLYVDKKFQDILDPLVISWGYESAQPSDSRFQDYHQMQGTRDFSAFLTIPASLQFMEEHRWPEVAATCREMVLKNATRFCELLDADPLSSIDPEFLVQLYSMQVRCNDPGRLQRTLFDQYRIEIPVMQHDDKTCIRFSINGFNTHQDLDRLYEALKELRGKGELLS